MDIGIALQEIKDWYDGESHQIIGVTDSHKGSKDGYDQSEVFMNVYAYQESHGMDGDAFHGEVWFEFDAGKFINTHFCI